MKLQLTLFALTLSFTSALYAGDPDVVFDGHKAEALYQRMTAKPDCTTISETQKSCDKRGSEVTCSELTSAGQPKIYECFVNVTNAGSCQPF